MATTSTKATCLAEMRASFAEVMAVVDAIPRESLTDVGVTAEWSVRDVLAHESGYERWVAAAIFGDLEGRTPTKQEYYGRDEAPTEAEDENDDTVNAWVVAHARTLPVDDVLAEFRWAHDRLVEATEACEEADFEDPNRLPFTKGKTLLAILPGQCWGHHRQHLPQIQEFARKTLQSA
jgi:hypothetical protein